MGRRSRNPRPVREADLTGKTIARAFVTRIPADRGASRPAIAGVVTRLEFSDGSAIQLEAAETETAPVVAAFFNAPPPPPHLCTCGHLLTRHAYLQPDPPVHGRCLAFRSTPGGRVYRCDCVAGTPDPRRVSR